MRVSDLTTLSQSQYSSSLNEVIACEAKEAQNFTLSFDNEDDLGNMVDSILDDMWLE